MTTFRSLLGALLLAATGPAAEPLSLQKAVDQALQGHPALAVSGGRIEVARGLSRQAGLRPNPRLHYQTENWQPNARPGFSPSRDVDNFLYLGQLFETGSKRERRSEYAAAAVARSELEREVLRRQIANRVKAAYWSAAAAQRISELLQENGRYFQQIIEFHETRVKEGAAPEADLIKVQLEGERLKIAANTAGLEARRSQVRLLQEMGRSEFPEISLSDAPDPMAKPPVVDISQALENRPEVRLAQQATELATAHLRLQEAGARPDIDVTFGYKRTSGFNTLMGSLEIPLPIANRNEGNIAAATAEIREAESQLAAATAIVKAEVAAAQTEVDVRRRQVVDVFPELLRKARESADIALAAYREGGVDLLRLLDAERSRNEVQVLYQQTLAEYEQSLVALDAALGVTP